MGKIGEDPNVGKETRFPHNDPTKGGRKPSIKKQLEQIALQDGVMKLPRKQVLEITDEYIKIKIPKQEALALKLWTWAMSNKGGDSIKAIEKIMEQFDGKAKQSVEVENKESIEDLSNFTDEELKEYIRLNKKKKRE